MAFKLRDKHKVSVVIAIAIAFFFGELAGWWRNLSRRPRP
jgi:hypothetical protein